MSRILRRLHTRYALLFATLLFAVTLLSLALSGALVFKRSTDLRSSMTQSFTSLHNSSDSEVLRQFGLYFSQRLLAPLLNADLTGLNNELVQLPQILKLRSALVLDNRQQIITDGSRENIRYGQHIDIPANLDQRRSLVFPIS